MEGIEKLEEKNKRLQDVGSRIRNERKKQGLTQEKLAELADTSKSHVSNVENGKKDVSLGIFMAIRDSLHVSADYLLNVKSSDIEGKPWQEEVLELFDECDDKEREYLYRMVKYCKELQDDFAVQSRKNKKRI